MITSQLYYLITDPDGVEHRADSVEEYERIVDELAEQFPDQEITVEALFAADPTEAARGAA